MDLPPEDLQTLQRVRTISIHQRPHKVMVTDFIDVHDWQSHGILRTLFPRILKGQDITAVVDGFVAATPDESPRLVITVSAELVFRKQRCENTP